MLHSLKDKTHEVLWNQSFSLSNHFFPEFQALSEPLSQMSVNWSDKKYIPVNIA